MSDIPKFLEKESKVIVILLLIFISLLSVYLVNALPSGPTEINYIENETKGTAAGVIRNETDSPGKIITTNISTSQQNTRWKAYVGNITGELTLEDTTGATIYDWQLTTNPSGKIYTTRNSTTPEWTNINCTWAYYTDGTNLPDAGESNRTNNKNITEEENIALSHTSSDDNITSTFDSINHTSFYVGSIQIPANECYTTNPYINNQTTNQTINADTYDQIILSDGTTRLIYASNIETDQPSYFSTDRTYDYQIILPEEATQGFQSSTAYYFYIELT